MAKGVLPRHRDFRLLWGGETVSELGSQVSLLAIPLLAVRTLHATTFEMGLLTAASTAAFLVVGLPAGVWVDRMRRRSVMIVVDLGRMLALGSVPVACALGGLPWPTSSSSSCPAGSSPCSSMSPTSRTCLRWMNATMRFVVWPVLPVGALIGGVLGSVLGLRPTLWIGATGEAVAGVWLVASPMRSMRDFPDAPGVSCPPVK